MSNIAGKSYAMNVITPIKKWRSYINQFIFWAVTTPWASGKLIGLQTLSLIHYARWVIIRPNKWPRLSPEQPKEDVKYAYMLFFSNFNGSWNQYVDSFHSSIPSGLDMFWLDNIRYPKSIPLQPFHSYINHNQIWTEHYYNAYPLASSNDVKSAIQLQDLLSEFLQQHFDGDESKLDANDFLVAYQKLLFDTQAYLGKMEASPVVSLAATAVAERRRINKKYHRFEQKA